MSQEKKSGQKKADGNGNAKEQELVAWRGFWLNKICLYTCKRKTIFGKQLHTKHYQSCEVWDFFWKQAMVFGKIENGK